MSAPRPTHRRPGDGWVDTGTYRPNLHYAVEQFGREQDRQRRALELVAGLQGSGIVYAATIKAAEALHHALRQRYSKCGQRKPRTNDRKPQQGNQGKAAQQQRHQGPAGEQCRGIQIMF